MRKYTMMMAFALLLGMTQCKKETTNTNNDNTEGVSITLQVDNGDKGDRLNVYPSTGAVVFSEGDKIYVGNNQKYVGTLTYRQGLFQGTVSGDLSTDDFLHFYFVGNKPTSPVDLSAGTTTYTVDISNQSAGLPAISYAPSTAKYSPSTSAYTAKLLNKSALVKFDLGEVETDAAITLMGMKTEAVIDFANNTLTSGATTGNLVTYCDSDDPSLPRYAIVLSDQPAVTTGTISAENYMGTFSIPTAAYDNAFLTDATMRLCDSRTPLTLEAITSGTIEVNISGSGGGGFPVPSWSSKGGPGGGGSSNISMNYSVNNGEKTPITTTTTIPVSAGDKVQFYGDGTSTTSYKGANISGGSAEVKAYGNIMSLVDETGFVTSTTLSTEAFYELFKDNTNLTDASYLLLPAETLAQSCYESMFNGCTALTAAPALPATSLAESCYFSMFYSCTDLTAAPALPATTLAQTCYKDMFDGCTALTAAPALPAETLAADCYSMMFLDCTALTAAPALPARTLAQSCYDRMFANCTSMTTAPELPATTLVNNCYSQMFYGCTSLNSVTCLATNISATDCTAYWLYNVATEGTFTTPSTTGWTSNSPSGIPNGWIRSAH